MQFEVFAEGGSLLPSFQFDGALRGARFDKIGTALFEANPISAPLSLSLAVKGRGRSADEFMRSLAGQGQVEFAEGQLNFIDVSRLAFANERLSDEAMVPEITLEPDATSEPDVTQEVMLAREALAAVSGSTPISRALGVIEIKNGVVNLINGEIILPRSQPVIPIDVLIDVPNYSLSLDMAFVPKANRNRLHRLAITGPLDAPSLLFGLEDRSNLSVDQDVPR